MSQWWKDKFGLERADDFSFVESLEAKPVVHYILKVRYQKPVEINEYEYETLKQAMEASKRES